MPPFRDADSFLSEAISEFAQDNYIAKVIHSSHNLKGRHLQAAIVPVNRRIAVHMIVQKSVQLYFSVTISLASSLAERGLMRHGWESSNAKGKGSRLDLSIFSHKLHRLIERYQLSFVVALHAARVCRNEGRWRPVVLVISDTKRCLSCSDPSVRNVGIWFVGVGKEGSRTL